MIYAVETTFGIMNVEAENERELASICEAWEKANSTLLVPAKIKDVRRAR